MKTTLKELHYGQRFKIAKTGKVVYQQSDCRTLLPGGMISVRNYRTRRLKDLSPDTIVTTEL